MKVIITGNVKHDNVPLKKYQAYDLPEKDAKALIEAKDATIEGVDEQTHVRTYTPMKNKVDPASGQRMPGEFEPDIKAKEQRDTGAINAVEPHNQNSIQGSEDAQKGGA